MQENETNARQDEKLAASEIVIENRFLKLCENIWFYHKWKLIIGAFALFVTVFWIVQAVNVNTVDSTVLMAGPYFPSADKRGEMLNAFSSVLPEDGDGDGEKEVEIVHYEVYSKEQFEAIKAPDKNSGLNAENYKSFNSLVQIGEISVLVVDKWLYSELRAANVLRPLSELELEGAEGAFDEYGVYFTETAFAKSHECFKDLPKDTVICFRSIGLISGIGNKSENEESYKLSEKLFRAILTY